MGENMENGKNGAIKTNTNIIHDQTRPDKTR